MAAICPAVLTRGFCLNTACHQQHDTSNFCMICNVALNTAVEYNSHVRTQDHAQAVSSTQWLKCVPCNRYYIQGTMSQTSHENGNGHIGLVAAYPANSDTPPVIPIPMPPDHTRCDGCRTVVLTSQYAEHCRSAGHIARQRVYDYQNALIRTQANQRGVTVSGSQNGLDLGTRSPGPAQPDATPATLQVSYAGRNSVLLVHARTSASLGVRPGFHLCFTVTTSPVALPFSITPQNSVAIQIHFNPHGQRGRFEDRLELVFRGSNGSNFVITRPLKAIVANEDIAALAPTEPYRRLRRARKRGVEVRVIESDHHNDPEVQLPVAVKYKPGRRLPSLNIPRDVERLVNQGSLEEKIQAFRGRFLPPTLDFASFQQHWSNLVRAEYIQARIDLSSFDMDDVNLAKVGRLYELVVPGLAENRPSVLKGDRIKIHPHSVGDGVWFEGLVLEVRLSSVLIRFHSTFPHTPSAQYDVQFVLNAVPFQRMLQALAISPKRSNILFPQLDQIPPGTNVAQQLDGDEIELYNHLIGANAEQLQAVKRVVELPLGSPPFVVFGPPGTGKTVTIVEAISQLLNDPENRILACAPSNSASDLIAERLISLRGLQNNELFRLNATWRGFNTLPEDLQRYSLYDDKNFKVPNLAQLTSYRVVVATCSSAALLYGIGVDPGTYTHIFVDEAGQGSEPEVMIPILTMSGSKTNMILSGDPKQLGPVIQSPVARPLGMSTSYLDRLMALPAYDEQAMRGSSVAKLLQNFRSHNSILSFPNQEFYGNELVARAPQNIANSLLDWNRLVTPNFPIIFRAVAGEDKREGNSPSYFNPHEASIVKEYVQGLLPFIASPGNIGIVTPYKAQVRKVKKLLTDIGITGIDIGSVEQFQGQERQVIILSTVRSTRELLSYDMRHTLGFVANERRLNVAITRAQSLLIVVGDPQVLGLDTLWRRFLYFIHGSGGWTGAPFPWDPDADPNDAAAFSSLPEQELVDLLRRATLNEASDDVDELDHAGNPDV